MMKYITKEMTILHAHKWLLLMLLHRQWKYCIHTQGITYQLVTINKIKHLAKTNPTHSLNLREWGGQWINISCKLMLTCGRIENYKHFLVLFLLFHCINIYLLVFFYYENIRLHLFICTSASSCEPTTSFVAHVVASDAYDISNVASSITNDANSLLTSKLPSTYCLNFFLVCIIK